MTSPITTTSSTMSSTASGSSLDARGSARLPSLTSWLFLGAVGLLVIVAGLGWNWKVAQGAEIQALVQADVATQMTALRNWVTARDDDSVVPLATIEQRLQTDAQKLGSDPAAEQVNQLANLVHGWSPNEDVINQSRLASDTLVNSWKELHAADSALDRQSALTSGLWGTTLAPWRDQLRRIDPQVLADVFQPRLDRDESQKQWAERLRQYAQAIKNLSQQGVQDPSLNSAARQAIMDWAAPVQRAASAATLLSSDLQVRAAATTWPSALSSMNLEVNKSFRDFEGYQALRRSQAVIGAGFVLLLLAACGLGWGLVRQRRALVVLEDQHQSNQAGRRSLERITRQLRQIMRPDLNGELTRSRVEENARSPGYALASLINQVLEMRESVNIQLAENEEKMDRTIMGLRRQLKDLEGLVRERRARAEQAEQGHRLQAQGLAALIQKVRKGLEQASSVWSGFRACQTAVQETTYKTEAIRTKSQGASKRVKRVGESTQSISVALDLIRQTGLRIQVLSFNAAIEAPLAGSGGRNLSKLVQEIQKLATATDETVKEAETVVRDIQEDAKQGVATLEQNTQEVVEANKRAYGAGQSLQGIERQAKSMMEILEQVVEAIEARALDDADLAEGDKHDLLAIERLTEQAQNLDGSLVALGSSAQEGVRTLQQRMQRLPIG